MINKSRNTKVESIVPIDIDKFILEEAAANNRSKSQQICYILTQYFAHRINGKGNISDVYDMERSSDI